MKKNVLSVALLMMSGLTFAQVGIGTANPNPAALLDVEAKAGNFRGVLIPRIPLESLGSNSNISGGKIPNSLLVFNTTDSNDLKPGYYFWFDTRWVRLISSSDDFLEDVAKNEELAVNLNEETLYLRDTKNRIVSVPLSEINLVTKMDAIEPGKYVYTSEDKTETVIDVTSDVIQNITHILNEENVKNEIIEAIAEGAKSLTGDSIISVTGGEKAVLTPTTLGIIDNSISTEKIKAGEHKHILITDADGVVRWVDATDAIIQEAVEQNEVITLLVDGGDGTFTYYNEKGIDASGQPIAGAGIRFDANTLNIKEREGATGKGIYDFYDGATSLDNPLMTINTRAKAIVYENNSQTISGDNLQDVIQNIIQKIEVAQDRPAPLKGEGILMNDQTQVADAVLKEITLTIADGAITEAKLGEEAVTSYKIKNKAVTTEKIAPGADKYIFVTKNGQAQWVPATDAIIKDVVEQNEVITLIEDNGDGTYSYYNEKSIDADGHPIKANEIIIDANTLVITEEPHGVYIFKDGTFAQTGMPLATIDVVGTVIDNISEIVKDSTVQNTLYVTVAAQGKDALAGDASIKIDSGEKVLLHEMKISVAPEGITTDKIKPGSDKHLLVTKDGMVQWVPVSDEVISEVVEFNEKVTILDTSANNGTFVYYNEEDIAADGQIVGTGIAFDANTLKIEEKVGEKGVYVFYDGKTSLAAPLMTIDVAANVIENITEILNDSTVKNDIYTTVAAQGKAVTSPDSSISIEGDGAKAVLHALELTIANEGVTTAAIAPTAVTTDKIKGGVKGQLLVTPVDGVAQWMSVTDDPIKEIFSLHQAITELIDNQDGTFTYFSEADYDANGDRLVGATGTTFSANTLRIEEVKTTPAGKGTGVFEFYDLSQDTPIATLNVVESVVENITDILNQEEVQNQLFATVAAKGKPMESSDGSLAITGGNQAVLQNVTINIDEEGVKTIHLASGAVTTSKIASTGVAKGSVLTANGLGQTNFISPTETVQPAMQGDIEGEDGVINIIGGGENVLFGDASKKVTIELNPGGVSGTHIGSETITNQNIKSKTIQAQKFDATGATAGHVATVNANGTVSYQPITGTSITDKGNLTTDGIIAVSDGTAKVLGDVALSVNNKSITADKLDATNQTAGHVATVNSDGTVSYQAVNTANITEKGTISTDGIVSVDNGTDKVLGDITLGINDASITNDKIAPNTLTIDKLSAGNEPPKRVLVIDENREIKWGELDDVVTDAAGNLTTDDIVELQAGDGVNSLFNDVKLGIKDQSITNTQIKDQTIEIDKLSSTGSTAGMVMVTNANGGFTYVDRESIVQAGEDLTLDNALEFLDGSNGISAVLADTKIGVKEGGITTAKLEDGAVTPEKISAAGADENAVLTADGQGNVAYKKLNASVFEGTEADLLSDGSLIVPLDNKAVLKETTIGIATAGVENKHLKNKEITAGKLNTETAASGAILTADGSGNASFKSMDQVAQAQGQAVSSSDGSIVVPAGNKAALQPLDLAVAEAGIKNEHVAPKAITEDKIGTNKAAGFVMTSTGDGGAEFKTLGQVIGNNGKAIVGSAAIDVDGGEHAALADVTLDIVDGGITEAKVAASAIGTDKLKNQSVTTQKIVSEGRRQLLGTDASGVVTWMDANNEVLKEILNNNDKITVLQDNTNGTFTYFNENQVDNQGNVKPNAVGVTFDANTLSIEQTTPNIYIFKDKASDTPLATIDTRAKSIVFEDSSIHYTNVEEAITAITARIEALEQLEIEKATLSGNGILVNGGAQVADAVFTAVELSIANEAVTTTKIKGGNAKQILVTNDAGKAQWVDATDSIIKDIVNTQERITLLQDNNDGTFTYFNENAVDKDGVIVGTGVTFNANTLRIDTTQQGKYVFFDKATDQPLATIDIQADIVEKITEIVNDFNVQQEIYNSVAAQGKAVLHDEAIEVTGGEKAALHEMTIALKDQGVASDKIKNQAVTEEKLFAGTGKESYVPVVQTDGSVKYQPMAAVLKGQPLEVDGSLEITGDASKALLQKIDLKVKEDGIGNEHIQSHAVTADKIGTSGVELGAVLTADGSGNAVFTPTEEMMAPAMNGDVKGSASIAVEGGENVLFGDENKSVVVKIKDGGVKGTHIAAGTVKNINLAEHTIEADKLTAGTGADNRVAVANATGAVTYQPLSTDLLTEKGKIKTDGIITVSDEGVDKVLADVTLGIQDNAIKASKLHGGNAAPGAVAMVGANGLTVSYQPLTATHITNKGSITTDGIVTVDNGVDKVLGNLKLGIKNKGISTDQLAEGAVENAQLATKSVSVDKISADGIEAASVLLTRGDGEVVWGELGDIVTDTAGNLTTDGIITLTEGDGVNTLLKDAQLSIADNSITKSKLSSKEGGVNVLEDRILVTDGQGGFDYVLKEAVQAGGEDLQLGDALEFTGGTNGLNVVLAPTNIDVKNGGISTVKLQDGAVTVAKMNAADASVNSVLTAQANGTVAFKELNETVFEGEGANLIADESIVVTVDNKAVLKETNIAVATDGIANNHLKTNAVTQDKISSKVNDVNAVTGSILTADGSGNTKFQSLEAIATAQGKAITATDGSILVAANKATLEDVNLAVASGGIKTKHIATRNVTIDKIGSGDSEEGLILVTDGQGGAEFQNIEEVVGDAGKALAGGTGITITGSGASHALLGDATVNIKDGGVGELQLEDGAVTTKKLANKNVTVEKLSSKVGSNNVASGQVLTADGRGGVKFDAVSSASGELKGSTSIDVEGGIGALLHDATVTVKNKGIKSAQLDDNAVTYSKIADGAITNTKIVDFAIRKNHIYNSNIESQHLAANAVLTRAIASKAVTADKLDTASVTNEKVAQNTLTGDKLVNGTIKTVNLDDGAVTTAKITAGNATIGHVLTVESNGEVAFKAPTGEEISKGNLNGDDSIDVQYGEDAVLRNVNIKVSNAGIKSQHLDYGAVGSSELADDAVDTEHVKDQAITSEKISSVDEDEDHTPEGYVLTSDGNGGAAFKPATGGAAAKAAMPKFFYAPSFYISVVPGERNITVDVYDEYRKQFGSPMLVSSNANADSLPVLDRDELDYYVLFYDEDILYDVEISNDGKLKYSVDGDVEVNMETYFNIVFGVRD